MSLMTTELAFHATINLVAALSLLSRDPLL